MRERGILFSGPMAVAAHNGTKTQTRRIIKPQPIPRADQYLDAYCSRPKTPSNPRGMSDQWNWWLRDNRLGDSIGKCPYGQPGDRLYIRERHATYKGCSVPCNASEANYVVFQDGGQMFKSGRYDPPLDSYSPGAFDGMRWRPSIHMLRWASRTTLEITEVRVQRLQDISEEDALAEGIGKVMNLLPTDSHRASFAVLWDSINAKRAPWASNPWVWVVGFKRVAQEAVAA